MLGVEIDVSRETKLRLETYVALVERWNPRINLIAKSTVQGIWSRHIADSLQIWPLVEPHVDPDKSQVWLDIGSGGGFPGMVLAILAKEATPNLKFHLVESDQRKTAFLRAVSRETGCTAQIHAERIECVDAINADIISARALAPLSVLFDMSLRHMSLNTVFFFPKGEKWPEEMEQAKKTWSFSAQAHTSKTNANAAILEIEGLTHV